MAKDSPRDIGIASPLSHRVQVSPLTTTALAAGISGLILGAAVTAFRHRDCGRGVVVISIRHADDTDANTVVPPTPPFAGGYMTAPFGSGGFAFPDDTSPFGDEADEGDIR